VDYDPRWPQMYEEDRAAIARALGPMLRGIEHVGSTSVPGLAAKPVIDIMLGVNVDDLDRIIEPLTAIGYEYNPDWEISMPMRRYFRRIAPDDSHTHHLHAVPHGGDFWTRHLRFRDYLRAHPDKAREYGELKKLHEELAKMRKNHLKRFRSGNISTSVSLLYLDILAESKNFLTNISNLVRTSRAFRSSHYSA